jgi:ankyrin repeat protein
MAKAKRDEGLVAGESDAELDELGFKRFNGDFIFVACSGDLEPERILVEQAIEDEIRELGQEQVRAYSWDAQTGLSGLDQRRSMQRNIPRPSADNCLAVVYLIGERIGHPLERTFEPHFLGDSQNWIGAGKFPLRLDWPTDAPAARKLLRSGAFPLTGGIFEFLAARGCKSPGQAEGKPVYMAVLSDREVRVDGGDIVLNRNRWYNEVNQGKGPANQAMTPTQRRLFEETDYFDQVTGVHNFLRACALKGIAQNPANNSEDLVGRVRDFVRSKVFRREATGGNPYRELRYYDVHHSHFYGRSDFVELVVRRLEDRLAKPSRPVACRITGYSGSGKSSVLRAGILRELGAAERRGRYRWVALRPEQLKDNAGGDLDVVETLLDEIEGQGGVALSLAVRRRISRAGGTAAVEAARAVLGAMEKQHGSARLLLALDQFEEIVDELGSARRREYWQPLLTFLETAASHPQFAVLYTLESSRARELERLRLRSPFTSGWEEPLDDSTHSLVQNVIRLPFAKTGYPLAEEVIEELSRQLATLRDDDRAARNSVLPLLALKLHFLWELVAAELEPVVAAIAGDAGLGPESSRITLAQLRSLGWQPEFGGIIDDQASKAWQRARNVPVNDNDLNFFLQPFVGVEGKRLQLIAAPRKQPYRAEQQRIESFRRHRLLVDVGDGRVRLVHQAVLDHWKAAAAWLERHRPRLERQTMMRIEAQAWASQGRPKLASRGPALEKKVGIAAEILGNYLRAWSLDGAVLDESDLILQDYCLMVFQLSRTPRRHLNEGTEPQGSHMNLAATYGICSLIERFGRLDNGSLHDLSSARKNASRPLGGAAWSQLAAVKCLLAKGASPLATSADDFPPVVSAIAAGRLDIFQVLMEASVEQSGMYGLERALLVRGRGTLVHWAANLDRVEMLRQLIDQYGFSVEPEDAAGLTPIHIAAREGALQAFDFLRERCGIGKLVTGTAWTCLHLAASGGHERVTDRILGLPDGPDLAGLLDEFGQTALHHAALNRHARCIAALLNFGLDPNQKTPDGWAPIHMVLRQEGDEDQDKILAGLRALLADPRVDPNIPDADEARPLSMVDQQGVLARELLKDPRIDLGLPVSKTGETGIFMAARKRVWSAVQRFIAAKGLPAAGATDGQGNTFLHHLTAPTAPPDLFYDRVGELAKEDLVACNAKGQTPFHRALAASNWRLAERLLATGLLDLHAGPTARAWELLYALGVGAPEPLVANLLALLQDRIAEADGDGWTALHHIAAMSDPHCLAAVARAGLADDLWLAADSQGRRPLDLVSSALLPARLARYARQEHPAPMAWDSTVEWSEVPSTEAASFLEASDLKDMTESDWQMHRGGVAFYPEAKVVRLAHRAKDPQRPVYYWLEQGETVERLNGTSPPIHNFNPSRLVLTQENVRQYLHFFCFFVRGQEGPFFILEDSAAARLSAATTAPDRAKIAAAAMPAWLVSEQEGDFNFLARVFYGNGIFSAYFTVRSAGLIEMPEDFQHLLNLTGRVEMPVS